MRLTIDATKVEPRYPENGWLCFISVWPLQFKKSPFLGGGIYNYYLISLDAIYLVEAKTYRRKQRLHRWALAIHCQEKTTGVLSSLSRISTAIYFELIAKFHSTS
jgi:hypothetical protein